MPARDPGVAKFGIALEWGSRGRWFESSHSDHKKSWNRKVSGLFSNILPYFVLDSNQSDPNFDPNCNAIPLKNMDLLEPYVPILPDRLPLIWP